MQEDSHDDQEVLGIKIVGLCEHIMQGVFGRWEDGAWVDMREGRVVDILEEGRQA